MYHAKSPKEEQLGSTHSSYLYPLAGALCHTALAKLIAGFHAPAPLTLPAYVCTTWMRKVW